MFNEIQFAIVQNQLLAIHLGNAVHQLLQKNYADLDHVEVSIELKCLMLLDCNLLY